MSNNNKKDHAGVWMDHENAFLIIENETGEFVKGEKVSAPAEFLSRSERNINNAEQGDRLKYFKNVCDQLVNYDEIFVFGFGEAQEQFKNHCDEDVRFKNKKISIDTAEKMTDKQMIAFTRDFFKK